MWWPNKCFFDHNWIALRAFSPFLVSVVMDEYTRAIQDDISWYILFIDDIILINETRVGVNAK